MEKSHALYLDLMKKTLSFALWPEPPIPLDQFNYLRPWYKRYPIAILSSLLSKGKLQLVRVRAIKEEQKYQGRIWPAYADTMIGMKRLDNLQDCVERVIKEKIPGDFIETGVWRGGACIFMRAILTVYDVRDRKVYVADSFQGLPKPDMKRYPTDKGDRHHTHEYLAVTRAEVERNFIKYGLLDEQVRFLEGWFEDTLPKAPMERLAILRLDADMYSSTLQALESLYPMLEKGGFCIVDDYALPGCRKAVDDYREKKLISSSLVKIDWSGRYWRKE